MKPIKALLLAVSFCIIALAQADGLAEERSKREVIMMGLYPPDIIMRHQLRLGITSEQRDTIAKAVQQFQSDVAELQWNMQSDQQLLRQSLDEYPINTEKSLAQAEHVLGLESRFKLAHFKLLIAIKNTLTEEQIAMIDNGIKQKREQMKP
jgi:Spy/CpxP family protein refolding chaperone